MPTPMWGIRRPGRIIGVHEEIDQWPVCWPTPLARTAANGHNGQWFSDHGPTSILAVDGVLAMIRLARVVIVVFLASNASLASAQQIHRRPDRPTVIGTNMHVLGGYHEIRQLA